MLVAGSENRHMRIALMLLGAAICGGAPLVWVYLNGMAAAWNTSNARPSIDWFSKEAFLFFWLPFAVGAIVAFIGWKRA